MRGSLRASRQIRCDAAMRLRHLAGVLEDVGFGGMKQCDIRLARPDMGER